MEQQVLKLKCCQDPVCLTRWGCGASHWPHQLGHRVKDPLTSTLEMLECCFPPSGNTKSEVAPRAMKCEQEQRVEEIGRASGAGCQGVCQRTELAQRAGQAR